MSSTAVRNAQKRAAKETTNGDPRRSIDRLNAVVAQLQKNASQLQTKVQRLQDERDLLLGSMRVCHEEIAYLRGVDIRYMVDDMKSICNGVVARNCRLGGAHYHLREQV